MAYMPQIPLIDRLSNDRGHRSYPESCVHDIRIDFLGKTLREKAQIRRRDSHSGETFSSLALIPVEVEEVAIAAGGRRLASLVFPYSLIGLRTHKVVS